MMDDPIIIKKKRILKYHLAKFFCFKTEANYTQVKKTKTKQK